MVELLVMVNVSYLSQWKRQDLQNLCPQFVCIGSLNTIMHMGHVYFGSGVGLNSASNPPLVATASAAARSSSAPTQLSSFVGNGLLLRLCPGSLSSPITSIGVWRPTLELAANISMLIAIESSDINVLQR